MDIAQIAANVVGNIQSDANSIGTITSMEETPSFIKQSKLGEKPVKEINLGTYKEPDVGVRIRMLAFPDENRMEAVKAFREITGVSIAGSKEVVFGNFKCPVLTKPMAETIIQRFKALNIYANIADGQCRVELE
jgi:ribosomal protein L7/L12